MPGSIVGREAPGPSARASGSKRLDQRLDAARAIGTGSRRRSTLPASIFDRSRMSLISASRSLPAREIVCANFTCSAVRLPSLLSASSFARISDELSGVRSSWLMLARNSLLYWLARSSSAALSVERRLRAGSSSFWCSSICVCSSSCALVCSSSACCVSSRACDSFSARLCSSSSSLLTRSSSCCVCSSSAWRCVSSSSSSSRVRSFARARTATPSDSDDAREQLPIGVAERPEEAELDHRMHDAVDARGRDEQLARGRRGRGPTRSADSRPARSLT